MNQKNNEPTKMLDFLATLGAVTRLWAERWGVWTIIALVLTKVYSSILLGAGVIVFGLFLEGLTYWVSTLEDDNE